MTEAAAIRNRYMPGPACDPPTRCMLAERSAALRTHFSALDRGTTRILDAGCGSGHVLTELVALGFRPENMTGVDLRPERIAHARQTLPPSVSLRCADLASIDAGRFDLILLFTVLSSVLDPLKRHQLASRLWNGLVEGGSILCYDFCFDNPRNSSVKRVADSEMRCLFPGAQVQSNRLTLAPPLARSVVPINPRLYTILNVLPLLRTHRLWRLTKTGASLS